MSQTLHLEKKDLQNLLTCLDMADAKLREQQLDTVNAGHQMGVNISALDEYYGKRLQLIDRNKKNLQWLIGRIDEEKESAGENNVVAVLSVMQK